MSASLAAPGDGHWDRQFAMPGTGTRNYALRSHANLLYAGGYSLASGNLATNTVVNIFDGTNWTTIGDLTGGLVLLEDFEFVGSNVYVGGIFSGAGGVPAVGMAKWDGSKWSDVGGFNGVVTAMTTDGTNLYVGGAFTNVGGILITNVARWDGSNWWAVGTSVGNYSGQTWLVRTLALRDGLLYAGGTFTNVGNLAVNNLAVWNGSAWSAVGGGVGTTYDAVDTLQFVGADLYVGGSFSAAGGVPAANMARWNGASWSALGSGVTGGTVAALALLGTDLYASGTFTNAGGLAAYHIARWRAGTWEPFGMLNGTVARAISNSGSLYFAGDFNVANYNTSSNVIGNHIIRWDGAAWSGVSGKPCQGAQIFVMCLGLGSDGLYMGGIFNVVGTTTAPRIARWDGTNWWALGGGLNGSFAGLTPTARAIKARNSQVFAGGTFTTAGLVTCSNIAVWNGNTWSGLGNGVDYTVSGIDVDATDVYVGGGFTNAYNSPGAPLVVNRIARWNSSTGWNALGSGVNGTVNAVCIQGSLVYAGGSFTSASGITANRIAVWDGSNWSSLGTGSANGLGGTVNALLADGSDLYVGGSFTTAGGIAARAIAKWSGGTWSTLGQGMLSSGTANVTALAKIGNSLYASGIFTNAGGVSTRTIARWDGVQWQALGSGVGNDELAGAARGSALAAWGNDLFIGGIFETAGLFDAGFVARWNDQIDFTPPSTMRLSVPQLLPGNLFGLHASATELANYAIEYSPDLLNWTPLLTNSLPQLDVTDSVPGVNRRVYRMREVP